MNVSIREGKVTSNFTNLVVEDTLFVENIVLDNDLHVQGDLQVDGIAFVDGERLWMPHDKYQKHIFDLSDFPEAIDGVIILESLEYIIEHDIDMQGNELIAYGPVMFKGGKGGYLRNTKITTLGPASYKGLSGVFTVYHEGSSLLEMDGGEIHPFVETEPTITFGTDALLQNLTLHALATQEHVIQRLGDAY